MYIHKAAPCPAAEDSSIDAADLRKMFAPEHVENIMKMADKNGDGAGRFSHPLVMREACA